MANYQDLKNSIVALIKQNGAQEITGDVLQGVLVSMVANLGQNYQFKGIAVPTGNPGTPDQNVFYFATQRGTYTNFGGAKIDKDSLFVFAYNGEWTTFDTGISAMPKDLHFLVDSNMAVAPYEDNVVLEMDVYNPSTGSSSVEEYKIPSATEEHAGVMSAADKKELGELNKTVDGLKYNKYDYLKINGLTTNSTSEQVKAALTPIGGTEVVFPTNGDTITNGTSISIEVLAATSNTFSYIYNNQLVSFGIRLAEGREAVMSKVQTSLLKSMYDFAKINALTDDSSNDEIEAAIKHLQTSRVSAPSAGALLVDASTLAPLAVVTNSSSDASAHIETFSYTHGGVKYTVTISGEQGALTAKVTTQAVTQRRYDLDKLNHLTEESSDADIRNALTPIGEAEMTVPKIGDVATMNPNQGVSLSSIFLEVVEGPPHIELAYECNGIIIFLRINKGDEYSAKVDKYDFGLFNKTLSTLQSTVKQQGTQIQQVKQKADKPLHDLFVSLGATDNGDGTYTMNELTDLTYEDLTNSYKAYIDGWNRFDLTSAYEGEKIRTNFIAKGHLGSWISVSIYAMLSGAYNIETFSFKDSIYITSIYSAFKSARKLKKVIGQIILGTRFTGSTTENDFYECKELESIQLKLITRNLWFQDSPKLTKESILYMIQNSAATSAITITLHPTAYAMAIADSDIQAALEEKTFVSLSQGEPSITE